MNFAKKIKSKLFSVLVFLSFILPKNFVAYSDPAGNKNFKGVDVSFWQGDINWNSVKESGDVQFAIIRTSFGWSNREKFTDSQLKNNIKGTKSVGIPIGAYHYSYATNSQQAIWEADFFIDRLKWAPQWEYPVFMDVEDDSILKLDNKQRTDVVITFLERVKKAGYLVGFYTNLNWTLNYLEMDRLKDYELWIAQWNKECHCKKTYGIWQYSSKGKINGIDKNFVDLDVCYVDYPKIIKETHKNGF